MLAVVEVDGLAGDVRLERGAVVGQGGQFDGHGWLLAGWGGRGAAAMDAPRQGEGLQWTLYPHVVRCRAVTCAAQQHHRRSSPMSVIERIQAEVEGHPIVLFMKGTPQFPMCGFSSRAVQALKAAGASQLHTVNVLEDPEDPRQPAALLQLADLPAALHQRRVDRRLRHHAGAVRVRRTGAHDHRSPAASELPACRASVGSALKAAWCWSPARTAGSGRPRRWPARVPAPPWCCSVARCRS